MIVYKIKCPICAVKADAIMSESGIKGTYREPTINLIAKRIQCLKCGFNSKLQPDKGDEYELWFKTELKGHSLWAVNEEQLDFLVTWLSGKLDKRNLNLADRSYVEILPKWLITNKDKALEKLQKLKEKG